MQQNKNTKENKIQANLSDVMHACHVFYKKKSSTQQIIL
jgi:hypothetical protein